jgi:hypothetical protein
MIAAHAELQARHDAEEYSRSELRALEELGWHSPGDDMAPLPWVVHQLED